MKKSTSWEKAVVWGEYQREVILPNISRLLEIKKDEIILDLGCGAGLFANEFAAQGAKVIGVDVAAPLIKEAQRLVPKGNFFVGSADDLSFLANASVDKITLILAIQNIDNAHKVFAECQRVLKPAGRMLMVLNHPAFRVPQGSDWGYEGEVMYRKIYKYLSEAKVKIQMAPGARPEDYTVSFHRPLQLYFKLLANNDFHVSRLEEWISHKKSQAGPRAKAEDVARKEIPLFLFLEAMKV